MLVDQVQQKANSEEPRTTEIPDDSSVALGERQLNLDEQRRGHRQLGTNRISKRHRKFLTDLYPIFRFVKIDDFQVATKAGYEICSLMDIDKHNRPVEQLLPNLYQKFKRSPIWKITEADRKKGVIRQSIDDLRPEQIEHIRAQVREKIAQHYYSVEEIDDPEKLRRLAKARKYDQLPHNDKHIE